MSRKQSIVRIVGAGLTLGACAGGPVTTNPPPPDISDPTQPGPGEETAKLPSWDSVKSGHPEGATNPPMPILVLRAEDDGGYSCFKAWRSPMAPPDVGDFAGGSGVYDCGDSCGTPVECPEPRAKELFAESGKSVNPGK